MHPLFRHYSSHTLLFLLAALRPVSPSKSVKASGSHVTPSSASRSVAGRVISDSTSCPDRASALLFPVHRCSQAFDVALTWAGQVTVDG